MVDAVRLELRAFTCQRDGFDLFRPVDLALRSGDRLALRGRNGAGKSTLLRAIAGIHGQIRGDARLVGPSDEPIRVAERIGYLGHESGLSADLSVAANLRWCAGQAAERWCAERAAAARAALLPAGLDGQPVRRLSAGQQRRVALVRLVAVSAAVWLLDEPFTALDDAAAQWLTERIHTYAETGGIVVAAMHSPLPAFEELWLAPPASPFESGGDRSDEPPVP